MKAKNDFRMTIDSRSINEAFSRSTVAAFAAQLDPTVDEITDIKKAMEPLFTTLGGERAGLGFAVMESFMDKVTVRSKEGRGTTVTMLKKISGREDR